MGFVTALLIAACTVAVVIGQALRRLARQKVITSHSAPEQPDIVITLVHGTWARHATWTSAGSSLCLALRAAFPRVLLVPLVWSGANTIRGRHRGSQALSHHLRAMIARHPTAHQYVIAHSHGGNIAMYSLRDDDLRRRVNGLVCLSTPFLHVRLRVLTPVARFALAGSALMLPLIVRELVTDWCCRMGPAMVDWITVPVALTVGVALMRVLPGAAERTSRRLALSRLNPTCCLLIRATGDEASAALGAVQLMHWITTVLWVRPAELLQAGLERALGWSESLARYNRYAVWTFLISIVCLVAGTGGTQPAFPWFMTSLWVAGWIALAVVVVFAILRAAPGHFLLYGFFLLALMFAPLPVLLALVLLPFGPGLAPFATLLDVSAEPTPPGSWKIHQLPTNSSHKSIPLMHSASYQLPEAIGLIVDWIRERENSHSEATEPK